MPRRRNNAVATDALAALGVTLRVVRDSSDMFPPLKSAATAVLIVVEMSQRIKSNRKSCEQLATRAAELVNDIFRQTVDYGGDLPDEVKGSIEVIEQICRDILQFMNELLGQSLLRSFSRQDSNKSRIEELQRSLDEALQGFSINLQMSVLRMHMKISEVSEKRHDEVLVVSRMSESERVLLTKIEITTQRFFFLQINYGFSRDVIFL